MQALRDQIVDQQRAAGVRVIKVPHALGFPTMTCQLLTNYQSRRGWVRTRLLALV